YFERERAIISRGRDCPHEVYNRQVALPGHVAEVAAPIEQIHIDLGCVGKLDDENAVARNGPDRLYIDTARQRMERIEDQADIGMICPPDDLPRITMVVDVAAPGERLIADAKAALRSSLPKLAEIRGGPIDAAERQRRD